MPKKQPEQLRLQLPSPDYASLISVANVYHDKATADNNLFCGRKSSYTQRFRHLKPTKMGNNHPIGWCELCRKEHSREEAVFRFREDLFRARPNMPMPVRIRRLAELLRTGESIKLFCFCAPQPCHCDVIRDAAIRAAEALDRLTAEESEPRSVINLNTMEVVFTGTKAECLAAAKNKAMHIVMHSDDARVYVESWNAETQLP